MLLLAIVAAGVLDLSGPGWRVWHDAKADWRNDELYAPGDVTIAKLPVNPPTGGWESLQSGTDASVPGTVEGTLFTNTNLQEAVPAKLYAPWQGVSWWSRTLRAPGVPAGGRLLLQFEAVAQRAEVFINRKLVGYDLVGHTPFAVDITDAAAPGGECELAVRVTNPGGNWSWKDMEQINWGNHKVPSQHSFGGITGGVKLVAVPPVYVDDLYVQNTPALREINVQATFRNHTTTAAKRDVELSVAEKTNPAVEIYRQTLKNVVLAPGETRVTAKAALPHAKLWDLENPNLYVCTVALPDHSQSRTFGCRWFAIEGIGTNALLRLNGKRIVLRTAISWGYWPGNGVTPTPSLAEQQIRVAKELGLNMLNFHRCIGQTVTLDKADALGLLYLEEPGGYVSGGKEPLGRALAREKLLRMVKRDRSHPSLIIYNMINEQWSSYGADKDDALHAAHLQDMRDAHALDPSRLITYTSAWSNSPREKTHMRPMDNQVHTRGWVDKHRPQGPDVWHDGFYQSPTNQFMRSRETVEVRVWGEDGAISAPPRLEKIKADLDALKHPGWDGQTYGEWYRRFAAFIERKKLRSAFPTVDALTSAMGVISLEHQGRKIELTRICDVNDGYAVNGWESQPFENHSGIVDCFRNPKAPATLMAYYCQPLYVAVKTRSQFVQPPGEVVADFHIVNERDLRGPHTLKARLLAPDGQELFTKQAPVSLTGGDVYGELLLEGMRIPVGNTAGMLRLEAELLDAAGKVQARGREEILSVDWKSAALMGRGAVLESDSRVRDFLRKQKGLEVPALDNATGRLDWIVVARSWKATPQPMTDDSFTAEGVRTVFYREHNMSEVMHRRTDKRIDFTWTAGQTPDPAVGKIDDYAVTFEGQLLPPADGDYVLQLSCEGAVRARWWVAGAERKTWNRGGSVAGECKLTLPAGKPVPVRVEYLKAEGDAKVQLLWDTPKQAIVPSRLFDRCRRDGTTLIVVESADHWAEAAAAGNLVEYRGAFKLGSNWVGGQYFVKTHPLFRDLPVNQGLNWPYQAVVKGRGALRLEGEELVAGAYNSPGCELGTAVGIVPCGQGRIVFSTLPVVSDLSATNGASSVSRKLLGNFIEFAASKR